MARWLGVSILCVWVTFLIKPPTLSAQAESDISLLIQPGDTWTALAFRFDVTANDFMRAAGVVNPQREPVIGSYLSLRETLGQNGKLIRPHAGGELEIAARFRRSPWTLAIQAHRAHPYTPMLYSPVFLLGGASFPREFPYGIEGLTVSEICAKPGEALAIKADIQPGNVIEIDLDGNMWSVFRNNNRIVGLGATDAFFGQDIAELRIQVGHHPPWVQPMSFKAKDWNYDQVTFQSSSDTSRETLEAERFRLRSVWQDVSPKPFWSEAFTLPLQEFVEVSSHYGARRSVNGGPYDTYHEGTDYSAYRGTAVYAPAAGRVVIAEPLKVRGNAVVLDHGLGVHSGFYHLAEVLVLPGDWVRSGEKLGEVGSTGRSTGNHLHWDLLIGTTWVDAEAWLDNRLSEWIHRAWNTRFPELNHQDIPRNNNQISTTKKVDS